MDLTRCSAHRKYQALASALVLGALLASATPSALAQDEPAPVESVPVQQPDEPAPPVTAVPNDPLVNEGASDQLDPNTGVPVDPEAVPADGTDVAPVDPETAPAQETCDPAANAAGEVAPADGEAGTAAECKPKKRGRYASQPDFVPERLNAAEVRRVDRNLVQARADHAVRVSRVRGLRLLEKKLDLERKELSGETVEALRLLEETGEQLRERALATFVKGDSFSLAPSLEHDDVLRHQQQQFLVDEVFSIDQDLLDTYTELRADLASDALELYDRQANVWEWLRGANEKAEATAARVDQLEFELDTWNNLSDTFIENVVWPIDGVYDQPLINSWGYPRAPGTIDEHWHEGIDIFAPEGERLVAAEGGTVTNIGVGTLGGLKIWILGDSGTRWYYAHLMAFNPDLNEGDIVKAGDLIGYIGKTGNAISTPPHLHLQMHPAAGRPVNPYPILQVASDRYQAGIGREVVEAASITGFDGTRLLPNGSSIGQLSGTAVTQPSLDAPGTSVGGEVDFLGSIPTSAIPLAGIDVEGESVRTEGVEVSQSESRDRARVAGAIPVSESVDD